ncbi:hypothetical protein M8C13_35280 [Crossiella sp. SN42]|uniref:DUF6875 domain-containing protein n=1 Tax=Crossiella sp. SN42 TaxID=2944808 RepID=UPI00207CE198|nr:hypothetical protein [Crossiella sp. SN42]MCO1581029.1 hypothetical protein [Crossiella sp. SN42]
MNPRLWTASEVEAGRPPLAERPPLELVLRWAKDFLIPGHPDLGRSGPVCPYTRPALRRDLFHLGIGSGDLRQALTALRTEYTATLSTMDPEGADLLTYLLVLPAADPGQVDAVQRELKPEFVAEGLMLGQFHPHCAEPGLWNQDFRPLRSPVPLLAIRRLLPVDLPFLLADNGQLDAYLARFAPGIPARLRAQLISR